MVERERALVTVCGESTRPEHSAHVVRQHVEPRVLPPECRSDTPNLAKIGQVPDEVTSICALGDARCNVATHASVLAESRPTITRVIGCPL